MLSPKSRRIPSSASQKAQQNARCPAACPVTTDDVSVVSQAK